MAIYNGRILMRKGNEADFDASKLMSGEWAVSLDAGIVRICLEAGKVIRMATYEAFEEDMKQIEAILLECKSVEEAVIRINTEINAKVQAVVEYVGQAKIYRDEALQFRNEAEAFKNQAEAITGIDIATTTKAGIVKPDGTSITVDADGTIHSSATGGTQDYTDLINKPKINGVELKGDVSSEDLNIKSTDSVELTQAEYDALPDSKYTDGVTYYITDAGEESITASNVSYDNSVSGLEATTTQQAIDKLNIASRLKMFPIANNITDYNLTMFKMGNLAMLSTNLQVNKDVNYGDVLLNIPTELQTKGWFYGQIIGNGVVEVGTNNQIVLKPSTPIANGGWITIILTYPIV